MSRRTATRAHSSGQKRKTSADDEINNFVEEMSPAKTKIERDPKSRKLEEKESSVSQVSQPAKPKLTEGSTQTEIVIKLTTTSEDNPPDLLRPRYFEIEKRALDARRRLDATIRRQHDASSMKKSLASLNKAIGLQFKSLTARLRSCQQSNRRLEKEIGELKKALVNKKDQGTKRRSPTNKPPKPVKGSRPQTVVVSVPGEDQMDDQLGSLKDEQKEENEETEGEKPRNIEGGADELIMDQKVVDYEGDTKTSHSSDGNFTFITLNMEEDYPNGSWLGDVNSPAMRVRCQITPTEMVHIMNIYKSADKLALKLLDLLFDKETQAISNLSGAGKHKKKKLDPLLIYGIHCHLVKHYGITHDDWYRIRQNIDSKCRTAFRRKQKGLDLYPKQVKKDRIPIGNSSYSTQEFQHNNAVQHLQQAVNELQTIPTEGLAGITIIQEQTDGSNTIETVSSQSTSLVGQIVNHEGAEIQPDQLKEAIAQAGTGSEIHLSNGQTIAINQSGELEIREVQLEVCKD